MIKTLIVVVSICLVLIGCGSNEGKASGPIKNAPMVGTVIGKWHAEEAGTKIDFDIEDGGSFSMTSTLAQGIVKWKGKWKPLGGPAEDAKGLELKIEKLDTLNPDGTKAKYQLEGAGSVLICDVKWKSADEMDLIQKGGWDETGNEVTEKDSTKEVQHFRRVK